VVWHSPACKSTGGAVQDKLSSRPEAPEEFGHPYILMIRTVTSLMCKIYLNSDSTNFPKILGLLQNSLLQKGWHEAQTLGATVHNTPDLKNRFGYHSSF
jgi:hypothetical protein